LELLQWALRSSEFRRVQPLGFRGRIHCLRRQLA
jgi:hypothetical protein